MKNMMLALVLIGTSGCVDDNRERNFGSSGSTYYIECIDGIEYWQGNSAHRGYMSVRIDPETMTFARCTSN